MKQVVIIHGGNSFSSYQAYREYLHSKVLSYDKLIHKLRWKERLIDDLPDFDVIYPSMPNSLNAVYDEWVIFFEKLIQFLGDDVQIVGHSLGAMFLTKYLNENPLKHQVKRLLLVAGAYDDESSEDMGSFKVTSAINVPKSATEVHLFHSQDDPVVPFSELAKFQAGMPDAISHIFENRGHFNQSTFPELLEILRK